MAEITLQKVGGRRVIGTSDLAYCNTRYHSPYLARLDPAGELEWQDKEYLGYGKRREPYYVVEALRPGDLIQAAGGSGGNKYPFRGRVVSIDDRTLTVEPIDSRTWSNLVAERKAQPAAIDVDFEPILALARGLSAEQRRTLARRIIAL